jgi:hypothetical protein
LAASEPELPGIFSISTGYPKYFDILSPSARVNTSVEPCAAVGMMIFQASAAKALFVNSKKLNISIDNLKICM